MRKHRKIIGAKVRLRVAMQNLGGIAFEKGEIMEIYGSYYGYSLKDGKGRYITRVNPKDVEFIKDNEQ